MPREPTQPLPELTTRGTVRKKRLYTPEEDLQKAVQMVRDGVFISRASRLCGVPHTKLVRRISALRKRGELEIYWGKNAPGYLKKLEAEKQEVIGEMPQEDVEISNGGGKMKKTGRAREKPYSPENMAAAVEGVKAGMYTVHAAHKVFNVDIKLLYRIMKECKPVPSLEEVHLKARKQFKLDYAEEQVIVDYALALHGLGYLVTFWNLIPLVRQILRQREDQVFDENGWAKLFVRRHIELHDKYFTASQLAKVGKGEYATRLYDRLTRLYDAYSFHMKPSRIYACEVMPFKVERWSPDQTTTTVEVEMLVASNAVGYHIFPPCVVHDQDDKYGIPDFLGLMEAGFVSCKEKKVTAPIMAEWLRSVFLPYIPSRSAEDPIVLLLPGNVDLCSHELLSIAEKEHVHLVPIGSPIRVWSSPILPLLMKVRCTYNTRVEDFNSERKKLPNSVKDESFPVLLRQTFSDYFNLSQIQEAFKRTGVFPLKPDEAIPFINKIPMPAGKKASISRKAKKRTKNVASDSVKEVEKSSQGLNADTQGAEMKVDKEVVHGKKLEQHTYAKPQTGSAAHLPQKSYDDGKLATSSSPAVPVKLTKVDDEVKKMLLTSSSTSVSTTSSQSLADVSTKSPINEYTSSFPASSTISSKVGPGSAPQTASKSMGLGTLTTREVTATTSSLTSVSSTPGTSKTHSDNVDNHDLDPCVSSESNKDPKKSSSGVSSTKPPSDTADTPSPTIVDHIQSVITQNAAILSSLSSGHSKPAISTSSVVPSQSPVIQEALLPEVPISLICSPSEQVKPLSDEAQSTPAVPQREPSTLLKFNKDHVATKVVPQKVQQMETLNQTSQNDADAGISPQTQQATASHVGEQCAHQHVSRPNEVATTRSGNSTHISQVGAECSKDPSTSATTSTSSPLPIPSASTASRPEDETSPVVFEVVLNNSELSSLSKLAKAFNTDVANIVMSIKNEQATGKAQQKMPKITSQHQAASVASATPVTQIGQVVVPSGSIPQASVGAVHTEGGSLSTAIQEMMPQRVVPESKSSKEGFTPTTLVSSATSVVTTTRVSSGTSVTSSVSTMCVSSPADAAATCTTPHVSDGTNVSSTDTNTVVPSTASFAATSSTVTPSVTLNKSSGSSQTQTNSSSGDEVQSAKSMGCKNVASQKISQNEDASTNEDAQKEDGGDGKMVRTPRKQALVVRKETGETAASAEQVETGKTFHRKVAKTQAKENDNKHSTKNAGVASTSASATHSADPVASGKKSPRIEAKATKEPQSTNKAPGVDEGAKISGARKRKLTVSISSHRGSGTRDDDSVETAQKPLSSEGRKTRAQSREETSPSRRTRSTKR